MASFSDQVKAFSQKANRRTEAIFKQSLQDVANESNTPRGQGGLLPVDTSFLQNSQSAKTGSPPSGPSKQTEAPGNASEVITTIAGAKITDIIFIGWTAEYSVPMNMRYGFRDAAVQNWKRIVEKNTAEAKRRIP